MTICLHSPPLCRCKPRSIYTGSWSRGACKCWEFGSPCSNTSHQTRTFWKPRFTRNKVILKYLSYCHQEVSTATLCGHLGGMKNSVNRAEEVMWELSTEPFHARHLCPAKDHRTWLFPRTGQPWVPQRTDCPDLGISFAETVVDCIWSCSRTIFH